MEKTKKAYCIKADCDWTDLGTWVSLYNLLDKDINDRMIKYNLSPDRADVIIPALRIFISTMEWANTNKLFVPKVGLVDGMIREIHNSMNSVN